MFKIDEGRITPQILLDLFSCDYRPSVLREELKHVERLRLELYEDACLPELACINIQLELAKPKVGRSWSHE